LKITCFVGYEKDYIKKVISLSINKKVEFYLGINPKTIVCVCIQRGHELKSF